MRLGFLEAPTDIGPESSFWDNTYQYFENQRVEALLLNEMPVGSWLAGKRPFKRSAANASILAHDKLMNRFATASFTLFGTRPVVNSPKLENEAFVLEHGGYKKAHTKAFFPSEDGFFERDWFQHDGEGFSAVSVMGVKFGFMICTELMFTEIARSYAKQGVHVIVVPRATGGDVETWKTASSMAAIVSGCYVVSSNRRGVSLDGVSFNGGGFAFGPDGKEISETSIQNPFAVIDVDLKLVTAQRSKYPCYITTNA